MKDNQVHPDCWRRIGGVMSAACLGLAACGGMNSPPGSTTARADTFGECASCPTEGWSSSPMSQHSIEDHLTAMCCLRHVAEVDPSNGSQFFYGVCEYGAYDWDCARFGGVRSDGTPGCPEIGLIAQNWIAFFGFDSPPTQAGYTGDAVGTCGSYEVQGFRYK